MENLVLSTINSNAFIQEVANEVVRQLIPLINIDKTEPQDELKNIDEASEFLHLAKATLYSKVSKGEIPHMKKGKRLYFSTESLIEYLHSGRVKTNEEISAESLDYVNIKKGGATNGK